MSACGAWEFRYYQYGCYAVLVRVLCCGVDPVSLVEIIKSALVVSDEGGTFAAGTDVTSEISDPALWTRLPGKPERQFVVEAAITYIGGSPHLIQAPFTQAIIKDVSNPPVDLVVNGLTVASSASNPAVVSYGVDQPGDFVSDLVVSGSDVEIQVVRPANLCGQAIDSTDSPDQHADLTIYEDGVGGDLYAVLTYADGSQEAWDIADYGDPDLIIDVSGGLPGSWILFSGPTQVVLG